MVLVCFYSSIWFFSVYRSATKMSHLSSVKRLFVRAKYHFDTVAIARKCSAVDIARPSQLRILGPTPCYILFTIGPFILVDAIQVSIEALPYFLG